MATLNQDKAIAGVGDAFAAYQGGLTPEQQAAAEKVRSAFAPTPAAVDPIASSGVRRYTAPTEGTYASEADKYYASLDRTLPDENKIREDTLKQVQQQIDNTNNVYAGILAKEQAVGAERSGRTRATSARSGTMGSDFGNAALDKTAALNKEGEAAVENERLLKINEILTGVNTRAEEKIKAEKTRATTNSETYLAYLKTHADAARNDVVSLSKSGASLDQLSDDEYKKLLDQSGYSPEQIRAQFIINKPTDQILTSFTQGNKYYVVSKNPATGATKKEEIDLGFNVPQGYKESKLDDGTMVFYPEKFDPNKPIKDQILTYSVNTEASSLAAEKTRSEINLNNANANKAANANNTSGKLGPEDLKKLKANGVPDDVSEGVFTDSANGFSDATIEAHLKQQFGDDLGSQYWNAYKSVLRKSSSTIIIN